LSCVWERGHVVKILHPPSPSSPRLYFFGRSCPVWGAQMALELFYPIGLSRGNPWTMDAIWLLQDHFFPNGLAVFAVSSERTWIGELWNIYERCNNPYFINKISRFQWPSFWNLVFLNLNLFGENLVTNLLPRLSNIRSL
jgi:hypothetical protein